MKTLNRYWINDGYDGVIIAKSFKQAMKYLSRSCGYPVSELQKHVVNEKDYDFDSEQIQDKWFYDVEKVNKCKNSEKGYRKSEFLGWIE